MLSGKRNPLPLVEKICELYDVSRDYIVAGEENKLSVLACVFIESLVYTKTDFVYKIC